MFRKFLGGLTSTAVVAGMVAAGVVATATPAAAAFTISPYNQSTDNPTLASQCGLDFGLVLDSSGSIGDTGIANLKTAANAFVDSLVDTGSKVAVTSFSTTSPGTGGTNLAPTNLTAANVNTIKNSYSNLQSDGWTNWQDGLTKMQAYFPQFTGGSPDLMVFITDGNPNTIGNGPGNNASPDGSTTAVNPAISIANSMKTSGTKMFGIAVGGNITLNPIMAITNQTAYNGSNFPTAGYVQTDDYAALAQQLKELAVDLCAPSLTITKLADTPDTQGFQPANGWTFDTTVTIPGTTGKWVMPTTDAIPQNTASTRSAATAQGGAVTFQWEPNGNFPTNPVIVKETLQNGYERDPLLACVARDVIAGTQRNINPTVDGQGNWSLGSIASREIVTCTAKNTLTKLKLTKTVSGGGTVPADWTMTATSPNAPSYSKPGNHPTFEPINGGVVYTLGETGPANYTGGTWSCTNGVNVSNGNQITVPKGTQTECTITNTRDLAKLAVVKKVDGGASVPADWKLSAIAAAPNAGKNIVDRAGNITTLAEVYAGTEYTLSEDGPGNYTASNWVCTGTGVTQNGNKVTVAKNGEATCEITNTRDLAKLAVVKKVDGGASVPADWKLSAIAAAPNAGKNIVDRAGNITTLAEVYAGTEYTLSEDGPGNYTASAWQCTGTGVTQNGNKVTVAKNGEVTCEITNTRDLAQLKLVKQVEGKNNPDDWTLTAKAAAPDDGLNISTPGGSGQFEDVYAGSEYTLAETGPGGYSPSDWVCLSDDSDEVPALNADGQLNNGDTITLEKGQKVTCTIINTRDLGSLKITKVFNPKASGYATAFNIDYKCGDDPKQTVQVKAGESVTIDGIPTGTECTVTEAKPTDPPAGWSFSEPTYDPANGKVTVSEKGGTVAVTVTNEILKPGINIVKTASATQVNPGETVTYTYTVTNPGDTTLDQVKVSDDKCAPVTYQSGDTNGDNKLQTTETWTFTCSMPITVATTNVAIASGKDKNGLEVTAQDSFTVAVVSPVVAKKICPIDVTLHKPQPKKVGNKVFTNKIKTKKSSCVLLKPVVLCRPLGSTAAGETAFCDTKVTKKGRITIKTKGYDAVKVSVVVRTKPKPGFTDQWKPNTWRKSWILR